MVSASLRPESEIFADPGLVPGKLTLDNYVRGWTGTEISFGTYLLNSIVVSVLVVIGNTLSCSLAAYAFARLRFRFRGVAFAMMLATLMLPPHVTLIPQYIVFNRLGWVNTFLPVAAPHFFAVSAFFVFLMVQFIRGIPAELDEAARIDGANHLRLFWSVIFPLLRPALVTTVIFSFIWTYNDFFTQLIYLNDAGLFTVPLGLRSFLDATGESAWGAMLAMSTLALLPMLVVFVVFQRMIVQGIATTGLRG
ncbi:carbohydrate ABC transporter permease [Nonomuraea sp. K274]|uniref:Carbohydrate ABC transporter permease n=2 Tax=Nonomuraea cypriaca TaxID=1187855 RepID=A0A931A876_9ACTN|nr:carbohydrate ABC transporter permease [Nonomuraea cypriaca]